jgi:LmeA-like phospholipid-binding
VVVLLAIAQLALPGIAEQQLRDRLSHSGEVEHVEVHAFPAIELLWHQADRVVVQMRSYHSGAAHLTSLLGEANDVDTLDASAGTLTAGLLTVHDAVLLKRGSGVSASALVTEADLRAAVPVLQSVVPVASGDGQLTLRGTATLFGITASVDAIVHTQNGAIVVTPDVPFGGFATITVFSSPNLYVTGVSARPAPNGFYVSAQGVIR